MRRNQSRDGRAEGNKYIILEQKGVEASEINKAYQGEAIRSERSGAKIVVQRERREYQEEIGAVRRAERRDQYLIIRMKREDNIREEKSYIKIR